MVTEWHSSGLTPLHLLIRQAQFHGQHGMIQEYIVRHPNALQRRTKSGLHPLQVVISKVGYRQRNESLELMESLYTMIRIDPARCVSAMRGTETPNQPPKKKRRRRRRY